MKFDKFKAGQKIRVRETGLEGYLVKVYLDGQLNDWVYLVCNVKLSVPPLGDNKNLNEVLEYLKTLPENIKTELSCTALTLDSENDLEIIE